MRRTVSSGVPWILALAVVLAPTSVTAGSPDAVVGLPAWDRVPSPNGPGSPSVLRGVQAFSPSNVWVVGHSGNLTLTERWNGSSFTVVPSPSIPDRKNILEDVDGVAPDDMWAVGHADDTSFGGSLSLALHWNGSSWRRVRTPNSTNPTDAVVLTGVAAVAPNNVWAVGTFTHWDAPYSQRAVIMRWNGTRWRLVRNACGSGLNKIDARSATDIWAVGGVDTCHWDGATWTRFPVAPPITQSSPYLFDVAVISATTAWAVGWEAFSCGEGQVCHTGEVQRWNGTAWTQVLDGVHIGYAIDAVTASDIWSVGPGPEVMHFDGQDWSEVPQGVEPGELWGVEASGPEDIWSAGFLLVPSKTTLVEHAPSATSGAVVGGSNVGNAVVSWFGPESGSVETDAFGNYQVGALTAGTYTFTVSLQGCQPAAAQVTVPAGETIGKNFNLTC
jgi:hypothetical protein